MTTIHIDSITIGYRLIAGTQFPITIVLTKEAHNRFVVTTICNRIAEGSVRRFKTEAAARAYLAEHSEVDRDGTRRVNALVNAGLAERARALGVKAGDVFADEFPGESLDPSTTDWDGEAWAIDRSKLGIDDDAFLDRRLWPVYQAALVARTEELAAERRREARWARWYRYGEDYVCVVTGMPEHNTQIGIVATEEEGWESKESTPIQSTGRDSGVCATLNWAESAGWIDSVDQLEEVSR